MGDFRIVVPPHVVRQLSQRKVKNKAIRDSVVKALAELAAEPAEHEAESNADAVEEFRQIVLDLRGGAPPSLDEPFADGLTLGQWLALSDEEQDALWEKWEEKEWKKLEKKYGEGVDVKLEPRAPRQERGAQVSRRARETRARYATPRKRTGRVRSPKR